MINELSQDECLRVIYADDDDVIRQIVKVILQSKGNFHVMDYPSGEDLIKYGAATQPDIILLDVSMPGLSGPETLRYLRKNPALKKTPVIFITSDVEPEEVQFYYSQGAIGVIPKPIDPDTLVNETWSLWKSHYIESGHLS